MNKMLEDLKTQNLKITWIAKLAEDKKSIEIEANADFTYSGSIVVSPNLKVEKILSQI
jgi:hypothetical protein